MLVEQHQESLIDDRRDCRAGERVGGELFDKILDTFFEQEIVDVNAANNVFFVRAWEVSVLPESCPR